MAHRPYAGDPAAPPSVTQILETLSKPGLSWGAAKETANYAVRHMDSWATLPTTDAITRLYRHHRGVWNHRALVGTAIHEVNAQWCQGRAARVQSIIADMRDKSPLWQRKTEGELFAELLPMTTGLAGFWKDHNPQTLSCEQVVRYRRGNPDLDYIGTVDWRATIGGVPLVIDLKTTGSYQHGKGKYWDQWRLQTAGYRYANEAVLYDDQNNERGTMPVPDVEGAGIVHIYADGHVEFNLIKAGPREHEMFLALRRVYGWRQTDGQDIGNVDMVPVLGVAK